MPSQNQNAQPAYDPLPEQAKRLFNGQILEFVPEGNPLLERFRAKCSSVYCPGANTRDISFFLESSRNQHCAAILLSVDAQSKSAHAQVGLGGPGTWTIKVVDSLDLPNDGRSESRLPAAECAELLRSAAVFPTAIPACITLPKQHVPPGFVFSVDEVVSEKLRILNVPNDECRHILRTERAFCSTVFERCSEWAKDPRAAVLWDLDLTLVHAPDSWPHPSTAPTLLRLCMPEFGAALRSAFPTMEHGILSGRDHESIRQLFKDDLALAPLTEFFSPALAFSSRLSTSFLRRHPDAVPDMYHSKYEVLTILGPLLSKEFKLIDDGFINDWLTPAQGLCVQRENCLYLRDLAEAILHYRQARKS